MSDDPNKYYLEVKPRGQGNRLAMIKMCSLKKTPMMVSSEVEAREIIELCKKIGIEPISVIVWTGDDGKSRGHMNRETYDLNSLKNWEPRQDDKGIDQLKDDIFFYLFHVPRYRMPLDPKPDPINQNLLEAIQEGLSSLK